MGERPDAALYTLFLRALLQQGKWQEGKTKLNETIRPLLATGILDLVFRSYLYTLHYHLLHRNLSLQFCIFTNYLSYHLIIYELTNIYIKLL